MTLVWAESSHHRPRSGSAWQKFEEACNKIHSGFNFLPFPAGHKCVNRERAADPTCRDGCAVHGPSVTRTHARLVTAARVQHHLQCPAISESCCRPLNSAWKDESFGKCSILGKSTQCNYHTSQDEILLTVLYFWKEMTKNKVWNTYSFAHSSLLGGE